MAPTRLPRKKDVALALLEQSSVFVHLDPRKDRVQVPIQFKKQAQLVLQIGLNMPIPIHDLHLDEEGVSCTLSFNRAPHLCAIPWSAVYALVGEDGRGMVWPDDVPAEVASKMQAGPKPKLAAVGPDKAEPAPAPAAGHIAVATTEPRPAAKEKPGKEPAKVKPVEEAAARPQVVKRKRSKRKAEAIAEPTPLKPAVEPVLEAAPQPAAQAEGQGAKPKRELPPYLRVIK
jgi:stringent starvation protein B